MMPNLETIYICQGRWYYDTMVCLSWHPSMDAAQEWLKAYMAHCGTQRYGDYHFDRLQIQKLGTNTPQTAHDNTGEENTIYFWDKDESSVASTHPDAAAQR